MTGAPAQTARADATTSPDAAPPAGGTASAEQRLAAVEEHLREIVTVAAWAAQEVQAQAGRLDALEAAAQQLSGRLAVQQRELGMLRPQLAALEEREGRRSAPLVLATPSDDELAQARTLVEEVRAEHERVRARVGLASSYEERLRRLEGR